MQDPMAPIEQLEAMRVGVQYRFPVHLRGFSVTLRPLSVAENLNVTQEVVAELEKIPSHLRTSLYECTQIAIKTLSIASTPHPESRVEATLTPLILSRMTPDELQHLYQLWVDAVKTVSPAIESITDEQIMALVSEIKKNDERLTTLSRSQLSRVVLFLLSLT